MSALETIAVKVEPTSGNVAPLLHEIRHALETLASGVGEQANESKLNDSKPVGATHAVVIDLRSLPLAPGEEETLETVLGVGEVRAELNALGKTLVQESSMSGVWIITHRNADGEVIAKHIEITAIPAILLAQSEDIRHGLEQLRDHLGSER